MARNQSLHDLADRVRDARSRMRMTQAQFAERMAVTPLTVHRWETGQSRPRALALNRLRELEGEGAARGAQPSSSGGSYLPSSSVPLDFAGDPAAVLLVAEAYRLAHGHQFNAAFASETARIDPLPHQRIAVYERMLLQDPLRFLLADDAGAGKTIMTGLYVREMLFRRRIRRVLIVPPAGLVGNWERELRTLFRLQCRIVSGADLRGGANPFAGSGGDRVIVSPEVDIHYGRFPAKTGRRPLANLSVAERRIDTPRPGILPRGDYRVLRGRSPLTVGVYPDRRGQGPFHLGNTCFVGLRRSLVRPLGQKRVCNLLGVRAFDSDLATRRPSCVTGTRSEKFPWKPWKRKAIVL